MLPSDALILPDSQISLVWEQTCRQREFCDIGLDRLRQRARTLFFAIVAVIGWTLSRKEHFPDWHISLLVCAYAIFVILFLMFSLFEIERPRIIEGGSARFTIINEKLEAGLNIDSRTIGDAILDIRSSIGAFEVILGRMHDNYDEMLRIGIMFSIVLAALAF